MPPGKDFSSVVEDYCHCHRIKPNVDVLCEAVVMAVDHSETCLVNSAKFTYSLLYTDAELSAPIYIYIPL